MEQLNCQDYCARLSEVMAKMDWAPLQGLAEELHACWMEKRQVFICGNGGSAANAIHIANDYLYPISKAKGSGLRIHALPANGAVTTCLANDEGYEHVFSYPLSILANKGDVLIVLSGSGNSANILEVLKEAGAMGVKRYGLLGYDGGKAKDLVDCLVHFPSHDMQICEDMQMIAANMIMQWLRANQPDAAVGSSQEPIVTSA